MTLPLNLSLFTHVLNSKTVTGDLNKLTTSGFYYVQNPVNAPTSNWTHLIVNEAYNKNMVAQLAIPDQAVSGLYYRCYYQTSWSAWYKLVTMDQVTAEITRLLTTAEF